MQKPLVPRARGWDGGQSGRGPGEGAVGGDQVGSRAEATARVTQVTMPKGVSDVKEEVFKETSRCLPVALRGEWEAGRQGAQRGDLGTRVKVAPEARRSTWVGPRGSPPGHTPGEGRERMRAGPQQPALGQKTSPRGQEEPRGQEGVRRKARGRSTPLLLAGPAYLFPCTPQGPTNCAPTSGCSLCKPPPQTHP